MAHAIKNKNVVYTGKVGAKMKPRKGPVSTKATPKHMFKCIGGPLNGHILWLQEDGGTLPIQMKGQFGHYRHGEWHPAAANQALAA